MSRPISADVMRGPRRGVRDVRVTYVLVLVLLAGAKDTFAGNVLCMWNVVGKTNNFAVYGVQPLGDWNGDGLPDLVIADPIESTQYPFGGAVRVYDGSACGTVLFTAFGPAADSGYGRPVGPGDVNGDGLGELVVVANDSTLAQNGGRVEVLAGGSGAVVSVYLGSSENQGLGYDAVALGDVDGDGAPDYAVSAPFARQNSIMFGHIVVFSGATGQVLYDLWGSGKERQLGWSLAAAGDVDQDGHADIAAGAPTTDPPVFFGKVVMFSGATGTPLWSVVGTVSKQALGADMEGVGDVDGDGMPELAVSEGLGALHILSAVNGAFEQTWPLLGGGVRVVAGPGDVSGDGVADLVVGVPFSSNWQVLRGGDYRPLARLGWGSPNAAGDVDQDGFGDYALVSHQSTETTAWLYSGRCDGVDPFGDGCPGSSGEAPQLLVLGPCDLRANVTLTLLVQRATPNGAAVLVFGQGPANVPVGSCVLHVAPLVGPVVALPIDGNGDGFVNVPIPPGLSGLQAHLQAFVGDAQAPGGFAGSNGLTLTFP